MHKASILGHWQVNNGRHIWKGNQILKNKPDGSECPDFFHSTSPSSDSKAVWIQGLHSKCRQKKLQKLQKAPFFSNQKTGKRGSCGMEKRGGAGGESLFSFSLSCHALRQAPGRKLTATMMFEGKYFPFSRRMGKRNTWGPMFSCESFIIFCFSIRSMIQLN